MAGRVGRPPKPTSLKILHGDEERRINRAEPISPEGDVAPPSWLDERALEEWAYLAPVLAQMRVLTPADRAALAILCDAIARHAEAAQRVAREGLVLAGSQGQAKKNPACQLVRDYAGIVATYGGRFGLTPSDRSRISVGEAKSEPKERLLA